MKTILHVDLIGGGKQGSRGFAKKTFDLPFAVTAGLEIDTPAWKESRKVQHASLNLDANDIYMDVSMGTDGRESKEAFESVVKAYENHGWTVTVFS
jgi:hypothetical protein